MTIEAPYGAVITVKSSVMIDLEFTRPLSPETAKKILSLGTEGITVTQIPPPCNYGFWIALSPGWNVNQVAQCCLDILYSEGFAISRVLCKNFVPNVGMNQSQILKSLAIEATFRQELGKGYNILQEGDFRYHIFTPFQLRNGDHLAIVLKKIDGQWILSDEGNTCLHLSCRMPLPVILEVLECPMIVRTFAEFSIQNRDGEILTKVENAGYGAELHKFTQALLQFVVLAYVEVEAD